MLSKIQSKKELLFTKKDKMIKIGKDCELELKKLIATRMLINANSGGGKSWVLRRLLEQTHGKVQQIVIDLEGEFITLREKYDYLLVGKDGEIPTNIRTAELLARRLLELNVSTIIDLSELEKHQRITFVQRFLDSLIDSPQNLWHPCLIVVDEAHHFCPEGAKSDSASSVIDLMTRGRKRGFCGILATQRISKLSKDAIAEANNCLIGRASLDIDQKRAGETLGFTTKDDVRSLRDLKEGEFYAFGSAFIHTGVQKIKVGGVETTHPDRTKGIEIRGASKTPENIKKLLKDVADLPKEADEELKTKEDMQKKIRELTTKLTLAEKSKPQIQVKTDEKLIERARQQGFREAEAQFKEVFQKLQNDYIKSVRIITDIGKIISKTVFNEIPKFNLQLKPQIQSKYSSPEKTIVQRDENIVSDIKLKTGAVRMLNAVAMFKEVSRNRVKTISGISSQGTFSTYVQDLKRAGYIEISGNNFIITDEGMGFIGNPKELPTDTESLISLWSQHLKSGAIRMLRICVENYPNFITRQALQDESGITSQGTFSTYIQDLKRNQLIKIVGSEITASEELFE